MKKNNLFLFSSWFMGVLFVLFAISMAVATFIENDHGAVVAMKWVYGTKWFELILLLLVVNLIGQTIVNKLYNRKKLTMLLFHYSFVLIIIGAAITRYTGFDGSIHIRQGESQNICTTAEKYINFSITNNTGNQVFINQKPLVVTPVVVEGYAEETTLENTTYSLKLIGFMPNAIEKLVDAAGGKPVVSLAFSSGMMDRQTYNLQEGDVENINGHLVGFGYKKSLDAYIIFEKDSFYLESPLLEIKEMSMVNQKSSNHKKGEKFVIKPMMVYYLNDSTGVVVQKLSKSSLLKPIFQDQKKAMGAPQRVLEFELKSGTKTSNMYVWMDRDVNSTKFITDDNKYTVELSYQPKVVKLPFELRLDKFVLDRYPGSNSPSSYKSEVTLIDSEQKVEMPYSIYMNHILKHRGYRFYQSSYDTDEKGTILSVNHDRLGMMVTYIGYIMLFLFIILSMIVKNSLLKTITINAWKSPAKKIGITLLAIFLSSTTTYSNDQKLVIDKTVADNFGRVLVQDQKGRTKPLFTLSDDIIRKVTKKNQFEDYNSMQVFLGFYADFNNWKDVKLIKISNSDLAKQIGVVGDYAAFSEIVDVNSNQYKLSNLVEEAYAKPEGSRNKFDKEVIKLDERINVMYMIYTGDYLKIFPIKDKSTKWGSPSVAIKFADSKEDSLYLNNIIGMIIESARGASVSKNYKEVDQLINSVADYQKKFAGYSLPSQSKVNVEVFYNKAKIFERLFPFYATLGLILIFALIFGIVSGKGNFDVIRKYLGYVLILGFVFHTLGLIIRWYISGHSPMSNGYESMLFISWATLLAGFVFIRRSPFVLAAASVLASLTLMVAHLSFMDPEITNLVPVLKSYWLTLHVSVIVSSYGFLGLGAILGLLVMILYSLKNSKNNGRISSAIEELTVVNYQTLTIGLYLLTIGTFLGAIWANESWGRYWGWDPKETWSLITMIVYSIVIHSRMIKSLKSIFTFNLLSLFAFSAVLMTYFGVNYYLSGLHSYGSGDPIPVPTFVYVTVIALVLLTTFASIKHKQLDKLDS
jgi:cytochrome c-type biogenesis protein CcsB